MRFCKINNQSSTYFIHFVWASKIAALIAPAEDVLKIDSPRLAKTTFAFLNKVISFSSIPPSGPITNKILLEIFFIASVKLTDESGSKTIIFSKFWNSSTKSFEFTKFKIYKNKIIYPINIDFKELKNAFNIYFKFSKIEFDDNSEVFFVLRNMYEINKYKILDNFENCYYVKKNDWNYLHSSVLFIFFIINSCPS